MTNEENIRQSTLKDLAAILCDLQIGCDDCPLTKRCSMGHCGFEKWLKEEVEEDQWGPYRRSGK